MATHISSSIKMSRYIILQDDATVQSFHSRAIEEYQWLARQCGITTLPRRTDDALQTFISYWSSMQDIGAKKRFHHRAINALWVCHTTKASQEAKAFSTVSSELLHIRKVLLVASFMKAVTKYVEAGKDRLSDDGSKTDSHPTTDDGDNSTEDQQEPKTTGVYPVKSNARFSPVSDADSGTPEDSHTSLGFENNSMEAREHISMSEQVSGLAAIESWSLAPRHHARFLKYQSKRKEDARAEKDRLRNKPVSSQKRKSGPVSSRDHQREGQTRKKKGIARPIAKPVRRAGSRPKGEDACEQWAEGGQGE